MLEAAAANMDPRVRRADPPRAPHLSPQAAVRRVLGPRRLRLLPHRRFSRTARARRQEQDGRSHKEGKDHQGKELTKATALTSCSLCPACPVYDTGTLPTAGR